MLNYSIHTFELRLNARTCDINNIRSWLYEKRIQIKTEKNGSLNILEYSRCGVRIFLIPDQFKPYLAFIVNLREVIDNGNLVDLIEHDDVEFAINKANDIIVNFLEGRYDLNFLELCRIDFCVNINVGSQKVVDTYIKLLNYKNGKSNGFKVKNIGSSNGYYRNEFRAEKQNEDIVVSIYNKKEQLKSIKRETEAERADGILRVEVQLKRHSTVLKWFPEIGSNAEIIRAAIKNSQRMIKKVVFKVVNSDDYCKMNEAVDLVCSNVSKKTIRRRMIKLLNLTAKKHSVTLAKEVLFKEDKKITKGYYRKMIREFADLKLNIVTLGRRCKFNTLKGFDALMS